MGIFGFAEEFQKDFATEDNLSSVFSFSHYVSPKPHKSNIQGKMFQHGKRKEENDVAILTMPLTF